MGCFSPSAWIALALVPVLAVVSCRLESARNPVESRSRRGASVELTPALALVLGVPSDQAASALLAKARSDFEAFPRDLEPGWRSSLAEADAGRTEGFASRGPAPVTGSGPEIWSRLNVGLWPGVSVRPIGAPRWLPGEFSSDPHHETGPGVGVGLRFVATSNWRVGLDWVARAERLGADKSPESWAGYAIPSIEFIPYPEAATPMVLGVSVPMSFTERENRQGVFFFVRWEEIFGRAARR